MMYRRILCPHCGNDTTAKGIEDVQKCRWCRRLFKVDMKHIKGKKWSWTPIPVDFPEKPVIKTLAQYRKEDIYGI